LQVEPFVLLIPKGVVINDIDRRELLFRVIEELKKTMNTDLDNLLDRYLKKD